jgi:hypothetical protein
MRSFNDLVILKTKGRQPASRVPKDTCNEILCGTPNQCVLLIFIYGLFNDVLKNSDYITFSGRIISE